MPAALLLVGDPVDGAAKASAWAADGPGRAWLDVADVAARLSPADGEAAAAAAAAATVELVGSGFDVAVAVGTAVEPAWDGLLRAVDHRVVVLDRDDVDLPAAGSTWRDDVLDDGVVRLRPLAKEDVPAVVAACQDPEISRWTSVPFPYGEADARSFLRMATAQRYKGTGIMFAVLDSPTGRFLGTTGLVAVHWPSATGTVGYWLSAEARGKGLMRRAVALLADWSFERLGLFRLRLDVIVGNEASGRVAEAGGFTRDGSYRLLHPAGQAPLEMLSYSRYAPEAPVSP